MREDLRHKVWMIALSVLGSFLAVAVVWLIGWGNEGRYLSGVMSREVEVLERTLAYFRQFLPVLGAFLAIFMALATGLLGFGYLFHKNRVDTYDSLPVKRSTLFAVIYVDGLLIWLIPFLIFLSVPIVMGMGYAGRIGGAAAAAEILKLVWRGLLIQVTAFLLVYNLVLVAVMLSGNILNALVSMVLLGFGAIGIYGLAVVLFEYYLKTFYTAEAAAADWMAYLSPLFSVLNFVVTAADALEDRYEELVWMMLVNLGAALFLGLCAWVLCKRRASELAEQGIRNRGVTAVLQTAAGLAAGMCGWMLLVSIVSYQRTIWGCFGAVFAAVFVTGVMDVIFQMDFKAFFAHKFRMAAVVAAALAVCVVFRFDLFGYDTYLPEKEDIAELAVYDREFSSSYAYHVQAEKSALDKMHYSDVDASYRLLEYGAGYRPMTSEYTAAGKNYEEVAVKVTLKNGRSYYRSYRVPADKELLWPIYTSEEYLKSNYLISDETMAELAGFVLNREGSGTIVESAEAAEAVARAYNQDVMERPEAVLSGEGVLLARILLDIAAGQNGKLSAYALQIYSGMEHSVEALRQLGYGQCVGTYEASEITAIELPLYGIKQDAEPEEILARAAEVYGVSRTGAEGTRDPESLRGEGAFSVQGELGGEGAPAGAEGFESMSDGGASAGQEISGYTRVDRIAEYEEDLVVIVQVTERAEIEELLDYISYTSYNSNNYIRKNFTAVTVIDADGSAQECYIQQGCLPQKYLPRFAEVFRTEAE